MYDAVVTFFSTFLPADFDYSIFSAFFLGFLLMLVYGVLVRPWLNLCGGLKGGKR